MSSQARELIQAIPGAFRPEKAGNASARFLLDLSGEESGQWLLQVADGACTVQEAAEVKPDVTIKMDAADFAALFRNELDPIPAFMGGKIKVSGNVGLVMQLLQWFDRGK